MSTTILDHVLAQEVISGTAFFGLPRCGLRRISQAIVPHHFFEESPYHCHLIARFKMANNCERSTCECT